VGRPRRRSRPSASPTSPPTLGDVVFVELPAVGTSFTAATSAARSSRRSRSRALRRSTARSSRSTTPSSATLAGQLRPFEGGWLIKVSIAAGDVDGLLDRDAYVAHTEGRVTCSQTATSAPRPPPSGRCSTRSASRTAPMSAPSTRSCARPCPPPSARRRPRQRAAGRGERGRGARRAARPRRRAR
jgi:glycine cleavage system H protein